MYPTVRVIPCLDVAGGRVVKGIQFQNLVDNGDPVELSRNYYLQGADELTLLDVSASKEKRSTMLDVVSSVAESVFIPLTVGGGVREVSDVQSLLDAGADKVAVSSAAVTDPDLVARIAAVFGSQVLVVSLDVKRSSATDSGFTITSHGGSLESGLDALSFAMQMQELGAGEFLVNSIDADGTKRGFDLELLRELVSISRIPVIASGGAGSTGDFVAAAKLGVDGLLAASVFHSGALSIAEVKDNLSESGYPVRQAGAWTSQS